MKSEITTLIIVCVSFLMIGADIYPKGEPPVAVKKPCTGYTIIEAGLALDCHGDTVKLIRRQGYVELATRYEAPGSVGQEQP